MNMKRMRGRGHRPGGNTGGGGFRNQQNGIPLNRNHVFDSTGPEMRVRGTAQQLYDKYQQLARDAFSNGDRVTGESYYQHAEHYFRIISAINAAQSGQAHGHGHAGQPQTMNGQNGQSAPWNGHPANGHQGERSLERDSILPEAQGTAANGNPPQGGRRFDLNGERQQNLQLDDKVVPLKDQRNENRNESRRAEQNESAPRERQDRYRGEVAYVDPRIDISSALEAELAAAVGEPEPVEPPSETRAIPILAEAPPTASPAEAEPAPPRPARRGRPRTVKPPKE